MAIAGNAEAARRAFVLRREPFGGILFDGRHGTHVELDPDGFTLVREWVAGRREAVTAEERALLARLVVEVPALPRDEAHYRLPPDGSGRVARYRNARVLAAPTLVDLQLTRRCFMGCPHCYASSHPNGEHMAYADALAVVEAIAAAGVCQLAVGGGEPLCHPHIVELLYRAAELGVVPNLTTTGDGITPRILQALRDCCGAVALSLEGVHDAYRKRRRTGFASFRSMHARLREAGIAVAFQITLSAENLPSLPEIVDYCLECPELYGVVFLAHKPVGRGRGYDTPLRAVAPDHLYATLRTAFHRLAAHTRVGYDCCLTPAIVGMSAELGHGDPNLLEGCSAVRGSVGITPELDVVPCTFLPHRPLGSLRDEPLLDIWHGAAAHAFRTQVDGQVDARAPCRGCPSRTSCLGGCPEWELVRCVDALLPPIPWGVNETRW